MNKKNDNLKFIILGIAIVGIIVVIGIVYFLTRRSENYDISEEDINNLKSDIKGLVEAKEEAEEEAEEEAKQEESNERIDNIISTFYDPAVEVIGIIYDAWTSENQELDKPTKLELIGEISGIIGIAALNFTLNVFGLGTLAEVISPGLRNLVSFIPQSTYESIINTDILDSSIKTIVLQNEIDLCNGVIESTLNFLQNEYYRKS